MTLKILDRTVQETNEWLKSLKMEMGWEDMQPAFKGLRAVLHVLRNRLTPEQAVKLGDQLPVLIRGFYYEGWNLSRPPVRLRDLNVFFDNIREELNGETSISKQFDAELLTRAVFKLLAHSITPDEVDNLKAELPAEVEALWPHRPAQSKE